MGEHVGGNFVEGITQKKLESGHFISVEKIDSKLPCNHGEDLVYQVVRRNRTSAQIDVEAKAIKPKRKLRLSKDSEGFQQTSDASKAKRMEVYRKKKPEVYQKMKECENTTRKLVITVDGGSKEVQILDYGRYNPVEEGMKLRTKAVRVNKKKDPVVRKKSPPLPPRDPDTP